MSDLLPNYGEDFERISAAEAAENEERSLYRQAGRPLVDNLIKWLDRAIEAADRNSTVIEIKERYDIPYESALSASNVVVETLRAKKAELEALASHHLPEQGDANG